MQYTKKTPETQKNRHNLSGEIVFLLKLYYNPGDLFKSTLPVHASTKDNKTGYKPRYPFS